MKAKILMIAMMAICGALSFTACSDDDDEMSNHDRYQKAVSENVKAKVTCNNVTM